MAFAILRQRRTPANLPQGSLFFASHPIGAVRSVGPYHVRVSDIGSLFGRISGGLFQQAFVVSDLGAAEQSMRSALGCTEFVNLPANDLECELRGDCVRAALAIGFARSGNVQVEVIE